MAESKKAVLTFTLKAKVVSMRVAALVTGGKDSTLALHRALRQGYQVKYLVTMLPRREDSWMFHYPNIHLVDLFAEAVDIPLVKAETTGVKEEELRDLKGLLSTLNIEGVVSGAIASQYQKTRIDRICQELKLRHIAPLWQEEPTKLLREILDLGFQVIIVGVYAHGFTQKWLGRKINPATLKDLLELNRRYGVSPVGEGGEYETLVLDAPLFKKKMRLVQTEIVWENQSGHLFVKRAELTDKMKRTIRTTLNFKRDFL